MKLKEWMIEERYKDRQVAESCGCSLSIINEIKNEKREPNLRVAYNIVRLSGGKVRYGDLLLEKGENE